MKLAVRKEQGSVPGGGFHYMLMPVRIEEVGHPEMWSSMGFAIINVSNEDGERLLKQAGAAMLHQLEVAQITEKQCPNHKAV